MISSREWARFPRKAVRALGATGLSLALWVPAVGLCLAGAPRLGAEPPAIQAVRRPARLPQEAVAAVRNRESPMTWPADPALPQPPGAPAQISAVPGDGSKPDPQLAKPDDPPLPKPDPPSLKRDFSLTRAPSPFWASSSPVSFGFQVAYSMQAPVPANGSHIDLLYAQPQLAIILRNFEHSAVEGIQLVNEGMLGGAVNPGGRVLGYTMLFRLEGRTRGNTKPLFDCGAGIVDTTINEHAYELSSNLQFTPQAGIGFEHFFSPQRAFVLEYRFLHMSNAGLVGPNRGVHSGVLMVGFRWLGRPRSSPAPRE
jgi:Lipid A 3-O-deacylase (PagL)